MKSYQTGSSQEATPERQNECRISRVRLRRTFFGAMLSPPVVLRSLEQPPGW